VGGTDVYVGSQGTNLSTTVTNLPGGGVPVYVRLWTRFNTGWQSDDYTYTAVSNVKAAMSSPANLSVLAGTSQLFTWSAGSGALEYALHVGTTTVGGTDVYVGSQGTNLSTTVTNLPGGGVPVYVRLWTRFNTGWQYTDYTYTAVSNVKAAMSSPANLSVLAGTSQLFTWSAGSGALEYTLHVGTTGGGTDVYAQSAALNLSTTVTNLPGGGVPVYVRLWTRFNTGWQYTDYSYTASP